MTAPATNWKYISYGYITNDEYKLHIEYNGKRYAAIAPTCNECRRKIIKLINKNT